MTEGLGCIYDAPLLLPAERKDHVQKRVTNLREHRDFEKEFAVVTKFIEEVPQTDRFHVRNLIPHYCHSACMTPILPIPKLNCLFANSDLGETSSLLTQRSS